MARRSRPARSPRIRRRRRRSGIHSPDPLLAWGNRGPSRIRMDAGRSSDHVVQLRHRDVRDRDVRPLRPARCQGAGRGRQPAPSSGRAGVRPPARPVATQVDSLDEIPLHGAAPCPAPSAIPPQAAGRPAASRFTARRLRPVVPEPLRYSRRRRRPSRGRGWRRRLRSNAQPAALAERPGPAFGVDGSAADEQARGRDDRTVVRPSIGLSPGAASSLGVAGRGVEFVEDDSCRQQPHRCHLRSGSAHDARAGATRRPHQREADVRVQRHRRHDRLGQSRPGRRVTGVRRHLYVDLVGLAGLEFLQRRAQLADPRTRTMFGAIGLAPAVGFSSGRGRRLAHLAGADHPQANGIGNKFYDRRPGL